MGKHLFYYLDCCSNAVKLCQQAIQRSYGKKWKLFKIVSQPRSGLQIPTLVSPVQAMVLKEISMP